MGKMKETLPEYEYNETDPAEYELIFAARMRRERLRRQWRQEDLATELARSGVSLHPSAIAKIERPSDPKKGIEPRTVRLAEAVVIARIFGLTVERMLTDDDLADLAKGLRALEDRAAETQVALAQYEAAADAAAAAAARAQAQFDEANAELMRVRNLHAAIQHERATLVALSEIIDERQDGVAGPPAATYERQVLNVLRALADDPDLGFDLIENELTDSPVDATLSIAGRTVTVQIKYLKRRALMPNEEFARLLEPATHVHTDGVLVVSNTRPPKEISSRLLMADGKTKVPLHFIRWSGLSEDRALAIGTQRFLHIVGEN